MRSSSGLPSTSDVVAPDASAVALSATSGAGRRSPNASSEPRAVRALRTAGWCVIILQALGLALWSWHVLSRASLDSDFAIYFQPWYQIAHGHLLPRNTIQGGYPFWQNDGEVIVYVLAPLYWLFPNHMLGYLWLQDLAIAGTTALCYGWILERFPWDSAAPPHRRYQVPASWVLVLLLLVLDPWVYWVASFSIHMEVFAVFFAVCAMRALLRKTRWSLLWCALTLLCGAASVLYVVGAGLGAATTMIVGAWRIQPGAGVARETCRRRTVRLLRSVSLPLGVAAGGMIWLILLDVVGAARGVGDLGAGYSYLVSASGKLGPVVSTPQIIVALVEHPGRALHMLVLHGKDLWANSAPVGLLGLASAFGLFVAVPTLLVNNTLGNNFFSIPSFQSFIVYPVVAVGSVLEVMWLARRRRYGFLSWLVIAAMLASVAGWFAVWFPTTNEQWVRVTPAAAALVKRASHEIPASAEVISSNGFIGLLSGRQYLYVFDGPSTDPVESRNVWFVLSPSQGVTEAPVAATLEAIASVARLPGVQLVAQSAGVWVFHWHAPSGVNRVRLAPATSVVRAWTASGAVGKSVRAGPTARWDLVSTGAAGYVLANDTWQLPAGNYFASVRLKFTVPLNIEVWDDHSDTLLARRQVVPGPGIQQISASFTVGHSSSQVFSGWGIFRDLPIPQPPGTPIEVRIWTPGSGAVTAYSVSVATTTGNTG